MATSTWILGEALQKLEVRLQLRDAEIIRRDVARLSGLAPHGSLRRRPQPSLMPGTPPAAGSPASFRPTALVPLRK